MAYSRASRGIGVVTMVVIMTITLGWAGPVEADRTAGDLPGSLSASPLVALAHLQVEPAPDEPPPHIAPTSEVTPPPRPRAAPDETPIFKKWWFWVATAAIVGATIGIGAAASHSTLNPPRPCAPGSLACFGLGRQ